MVRARPLLEESAAPTAVDRFGRFDVGRESHSWEGSYGNKVKRNVSLRLIE